MYSDKNSRQDEDSHPRSPGFYIWIGLLRLFERRTISWVPRTPELDCLTVLKAGSPKSRCHQGQVLFETLGRILPCLFPFLLWLETLGVPGPADTPSNLLLLQSSPDIPLCVLLHVVVFPLLVRTPVILDWSQPKASF